MTIFAANWKMHHGPRTAAAYMETFLGAHVSHPDRTVAFFPPATSLPTVADAIGVPALIRRVLPVPARSRKWLTVGPGHKQLTQTPLFWASFHNASLKDNTKALEA